MYVFLLRRFAHWLLQPDLIFGGLLQLNILQWVHRVKGKNLVSGLHIRVSHNKCDQIDL